jgi:hypothetical protein
VDQSEFRRRIEIYLEQEGVLSAADRSVCAEVVARRVWPLVDGWRADRDAVRSNLAWVGARLGESWPDVKRALSVEQTGDEAWWA